MARDLLHIVALILFAGGVLGSVPISAGQPFSAQSNEEIADERGLPFPSEHYAPSEYGQDHQNWAVAQDDNGLTYVANSNGVMQYDGERWRPIPFSSTPARSLASDSLVFVGAKGDFGYLRPDSFGRLRYQSLSDHIPEGEQDFEDVWETHVLPDGSYFQANERLFRWDGSKITSWRSEEGFHTSFTVGDTLYVREIGRGLLRMKDDSLRLVNGGEAFSDTPIYMASRHPSGDLLIATQKMGLQLHNGQGLRPLAPELTSLLDEKELYHGCKLPGDRYALATLEGGVLIIGAEGNVLRVLDKSSGLPDEVVNYVYAGREGQLWMALNNDGVYRADLNAPTTLHDERTGLEGTIRSIHRHDGRLHVATGSGLYMLRGDGGDSPEDERARFVKREGPPLSWDLLTVEDDLLAATNKGVYQINGQESQSISEGLTYDLYKPENSPLIYAGTRSGVTVLRRAEGEWESFPIEGLDEEIRALAIDSNGCLWASTADNTILRVQLSEDYRQVRSVMRFDQESGLPDIYKVPTTVGGQLTIRSKQGNFQVENPDAPPEEWRFGLRPSLLPDVEGADTLAAKAFFEDDEGMLWVAMGNRFFAGQQTEEDRYLWKPVEPLHFGKPGRVRFYIEEEGTIWLSSDEKLIRYAPGERELTQPKPEFRAMVRRVTALRNNRVVYGGTSIGRGTSHSLTISHANNDLRIDVAAPLYSTADPHRYQYKLAGHSDQWSDWTEQASVTYADLWEGTYQFQVRAHNDREEISNTGTLTLHIQPPWYRTGWAYLLYGIGLVFLGLALRRYYLTKKENQQTKEELRRYQEELTQLVRERTQKLEESEAKFRTLAENSIVGTLLIQKGRMQYVNQAFAQMYGYTPEELIGQRYLETLVHPDDRERVRRRYDRCLSGEVESTEFQFKGMTKEGETIYVKGFGSRIDYQGRPAIIGTEIDVTERTRLQREVLRVQEEERRRIGQDLHDGVASQLTGVSLMLDTMAHRKVEDGIADRLQEIRDLVVESCEDIRQLSRGLNPTGLSEGDLPAALKRLADNNEGCSFEAIGFDSDRDVPRPDDLPYLEDDASVHLYCIAQEAVANARKYAEAGEIVIRLRQEDDALFLIVEDDGEGFHISDIEKEESLGLRSMRYRAELLGAELAIESSPGDGTHIRCRLPRNEKKSPEVG